MQQHQKNAIEVARFLEKHPKIEKVLYPGLESHKNSALLKTQTTPEFQGGGMISFYIRGGAKSAEIFLENVKIFQLAESL